MAGLASGAKGLLARGAKGAGSAAAPVEQPVTEAVEEVEAAAPAVAPTVKKDAGKQAINSLAAEFHTEVAESEWGAKSGSIAYVTALGDPSEKDNPKFTKVDADGNKIVEEKVLSRIVGYRFRALEDVSVPDFGATERFSGTRLMVAANVNNWRDVKKGEEFDLTRVEAMALLSQPAFNMEATGGDYKVRLNIRFSSLKSHDPASAEDLPDVSLSLIKGQNGSLTSIKDLGIEDVLEYTPNEGNRFQSGTFKLFPKYEGTAFAYRAVDRAALRATRAKNSAAKQAPGAANRAQVAAAQVLLSRLASK